MLSRLNSFLLAHASGRSVLLWLVVTIVSFVIMAFLITPAFTEATDGLNPFDLNFGITAEQAYAELPRYTDRSKTLYLWFAIVDYIYPFANSLFFVLLWCWIFNKRTNRFFEILTSKGILLIPFLFALVDWSENVGFLIVVFTYPAEYPDVANAAGMLKSSKRFFLMANVALTLAFAAVATLQWWRQRK
ncbi:MAG: hypothetical protein CL799_08150 [Chromatiales bacterium]|jgi:hypothetical protein|nr:hypothetical protein [Chromatiales bacterium]MDP7271506.1 hypothetical protein [Gammaproteobacteria bacterium]HJP05656.1 hypothetical protein [Gammaproteobacteria bacterium]